MKFSIESLYSWYRNLLRNPKYRWWVVVGTAVYLLSPIDIAPDFLPIVGQVDDVLLLTLLITEVSGMLIEGFKARQGDTDTRATNAPVDATSTDNTVIDVDAVSMKQ